MLATLRPSLATVPGSLLICLSTPYARRGQLWKAYKEHYGREEENWLVIKAPTRALNQTISQELIDEALAEDPATARAEWLGEFRSDIESYVSPEGVEQCVVTWRWQCGNDTTFWITPSVQRNAFDCES